MQNFTFSLFYDFYSSEQPSFSAQVFKQGSLIAKN